MHMLLQWIELQQTPAIVDRILPTTSFHGSHQKSLERREEARSVGLSLHQAPLIEQAFGEVPSIEGNGLRKAWKQLQICRLYITAAYRLSQAVKFPGIYPMIGVTPEANAVVVRL